MLRTQAGPAIGDTPHASLRESRNSDKLPPLPVRPFSDRVGRMAAKRLVTPGTNLLPAAIEALAVLTEKATTGTCLDEILDLSAQLLGEALGTEVGVYERRSSSGAPVWRAGSEVPSP